MRLGLLLGDSAKKGVQRTSRPHIRNAHNESCASISSLTSFADPHASIQSTNTSPVSTLTGSSEADVHHLRGVLKDPGSDSVGSLMSMSISGQSNCSSSPVSRRHSVTSKYSSVM